MTKRAASRVPVSLGVAVTLASLLSPPTVFYCEVTCMKSREIFTVRTCGANDKPGRCSEFHLETFFEEFSNVIPVAQR